MQGNRSIDDIVAICKCSVSLYVNEHRDYYWTFQEGLEDAELNHGASSDVIQEMQATGYIVSLQAYPNTPIGFERVYGGSVQGVIDRMYALLTGEQT
jgi:hypothetical protein